MTTEDAIRKFLSSVREGIRKEQGAKKMRSSGASSDSLKITSKKTSGQLRGLHYFYQQFHGRKPGTMPPIEAIKEWIREKGIQPVDITETSLAWAIAKKIAKKGTDIYQGVKHGIDLDVIVADNLDDLRTDLKSIVKKKLKASIVNQFSKV